MWVKRKGLSTGVILVLPAIIIIFLGIAYPVFFNLYMSLLQGELSDFNNQRFVGLVKYYEVFRAKEFWEILKNTLVWTIGITGIIELLSLFTAILLNQDIKGRVVYRVILLLPWVIPGVVAAILWRYMLDPQFGSVNDILWRLKITAQFFPWLGSPKTSLMAVMLVYIWKVYPFPMVMFLASLQSIPGELYEAAYADGTSGWQAFRYITLPLLKNAVTVTTILMLILAFNSFDLIYIMTGGGPLRSSEILAMHVYNLGFTKLDYNAGAAVASFMFLISLIFIFLYINRSKMSDQTA